MKKDAIEYGTTDLALAAYLLVKQLPFLRLRWDEPHRARFQFADAVSRERLCSAFWAGSARVAPLEYADALRRLKGAVREHERQMAQPR